MSQSVVAYELAILGAELPDDGDAGGQINEELNRIVVQMDGDVVGLWEWHFPTFDAAVEVARGFRRIGLAFDAVQIKTVDAGSGKQLLSKMGG